MITAAQMKDERAVKTVRYHHFEMQRWAVFMHNKDVWREGK